MARWWSSMFAFSLAQLYAMVQWDAPFLLALWPGFLCGGFVWSLITALRQRAKS